MTDSAPKSNLLRPLAWLAALAGAFTCILVPALFAQPGGRDFPLPGLYFLEIALLGVFVMLFVARQSQLGARWHALPWLTAGIILAFVILGAFSFGFYLIPALVAFVVVGILADRQAGGATAQHVGLLFVAAVIQAAVMLLIILWR